MPNPFRKRPPEPVPTPEPPRCEVCGLAGDDVREGPGTNRTLCYLHWVNSIPEFPAADWRRDPHDTRPRAR
jgi:hypothetical protein